MANDRLTREQVLVVAERLLADFGWTLHIAAYRTHTGDPSRNPWTGPLAWECRLSTTWRSTDELLAAIETLREVGLDLQAIGGGGDGAHFLVTPRDDDRILTE